MNMKTSVLAVAVSLLVASGCSDGQQSQPSAKKMELTSIPEETLSGAKHQGFDYEGTFKRAKGNDPAALVDLVKFTLHTDAAAAMGHGLVMAYLIQELGDQTFSAAVATQDRDVRSRVLRALEAGLYSGPNAPGVPVEKFAPETHRALVKE